MNTFVIREPTVPVIRAVLLGMQDLGATEAWGERVDATHGRITVNITVDSYTAIRAIFRRAAERAT